jgi:NAD-dependent DNA ligase
MKIEIPTNCPCCEYTLEWVNDQLFCRNTACSAQLSAKVEHFCKTLGIKGFGPKTVEKLQISDITEIYYLDVQQVAEVLNSERTALKLLDEIERSKGADLATVLAAFSIPLIGNTASTKICGVVGHIDEITHEKCKESGLGEKATANLLTWIETEYTELKEFLPFSFRSNVQVTSGGDGPTVCITGKLTSFKTKSAANEALAAAGYKVVDSVTKTLSYLIDEANDNSSKRKKAEQYGITIVDNLIQFLQKA